MGLKFRVYGYGKGLGFTSLSLQVGEATASPEKEQMLASVENRLKALDESITAVELDIISLQIP